MRARVIEAYDVLRDPAQRAAHRREAYPLDYDSIADLSEQRANALSLRDDESGAKAERTTAGELARAAAPVRKVSMADLLRVVEQAKPGSGPGGAASPAGEAAPTPPAPGGRPFKA